MEKLRYLFKDQLTTREIVNLVDDYQRDVVPEVELKNDYAKGNNPSILRRIYPANAPANRIPVPYGRRITSIVSSYMFLPGLISYASDNDAYLEALLEIFEANDEPLETYKIGWQTTVHGIGYELFWLEGREEEPTLIDNQPGFATTLPRFVRVPVVETLPIYDFAVVPNMQGFLRFYEVESEGAQYIHAYYPTMRLDYRRKKESQELELVREQEHGFDRPPLVAYENNDDLLGDFQAVVPLIDAYDVLMSDGLNEFDRFAQAYLVAKGFVISKDDTKDLKEKRAFSLPNKDDSIEFLTKPIEVEFIKHMGEQLRAEIHRGTGLPNLDDYKWGGGASGETIDKFIYLMELFTGIKEAYFTQGLRQRIELLTNAQNWADNPKDIEIIMDRNDPDKSALLAELLEKYSGHVSDETLLEQFAPFVTDVPAELARLKAEQEAAFEVNLDQFSARQAVAPEEPEEEEDANAGPGEPQ